MTVVVRWTGLEVLALRKALRKTGRDFAAEVGVSHRMLTKWETRGEQITPRAGNQAALDTLLATAGLEAQERFAAAVTERAAAVQDARAEELLRREPRYTKSPVDGKLMVTVDEGIYLSGPKNTPAWTEAYLIDVYPVTNADYARFVRATGHRVPQHWPDGRCPDSLCDHPVVWVTWHDAAAYAKWAGKSLPTSRQWEKAARGSKGRTYPWGDEPTAAKCNVLDSGMGRTTPVFRYQSGVSPYGVFDLCGNTWEWCADETQPGRHELKGSAFTSPFTRAAPSLVNDADATMFDNDTGFRCVGAGP
ncbi:SUMF1/EgtB/PvdO family nonheme iron enzyme [Streptomyces griseoaurantiacus]|uniref:SUMF1/EgtB/PvdO family nonheme iron enzyme n=1 Tax=Streptomyces griseoaurantiacus TaxID=68213 RepID=UPI002E2A2D53|nr:SUMF1/EgtB/PvdO family nonheme iron enzyme [Streptomyces jietaisiensis]